MNRSRTLIVGAAVGVEYTIIFGTLAILLALPDSWKQNQIALAFGIAALFLLAFCLMSLVWSVIDPKHADEAFNVAAGQFVASFAAFLIMGGVIILPSFFMFLYGKLFTGPLAYRFAWGAGIFFVLSVIFAWLGLNIDREIKNPEPVVK